VDRDGGHTITLSAARSVSTVTSNGLEAAWKYIIVTTIGISFGLFGTVLVYGRAAHAQGGVLAGAMKLVEHRCRRTSPRPRDHPYRIHLRDSGLRDQGRLAPVHMWLPDAHSQAPNASVGPCCRALSSSVRCLV